MFVPGASSASLEIKVKAFPLKPIRAQYWDKLLDEIARVAKDLVGMSTAGEPAGRRAMAMADAPAGGPGSRVQGARVPVVLRAQDMDFSLHKDTALLLVRGPQEFIEAVESIVSAFQVNKDLFLPTPPEK